jgi:hypothetical protein
MKQIILRSAVLICSLVGGMSWLHAAPPPRPNVVLILADAV